MGRVLVVGEALIDVVHTRARVTEHPGGSPLNVAAGLARLGDPVDFLTAIGTDERGDAVLRHLRESGVRLVPGSVTAGTTSTATATIDESGGATYSFDFHWAIAPAVGLHDHALLHVGSLGCFVEPGAGQVADLVRRAGAETIVTFDPNLRPALLPAEREVRGRFDEFASMSAVVKLSDEDASYLWPGVARDEVIARLLELGVQVAVVTGGADGALLATASARVHVPSTASQVVDTIGAGDSFMAGLIHMVLGRPSSVGTAVNGPPSLDLGRDELTEVGRFAALCAGVTVSHAGAYAPTVAEVMAGAARLRSR